jgi:hypothetical protein
MFGDDTTGTRLHYIDVAWFAPHVVGLQRSGATGELTRLFEVIEMHSAGIPDLSPARTGTCRYEP